MNLLKQTALILGLASLSLGGWTLVRDWKNKVAILFSLVCLVVSIWALSFVSHATLFGRLSYDIHLFCNAFLVPLTLDLVGRIFLREQDGLSRVLRGAAWAGAGIAGFLILFSLGGFRGFREAVLFWPTLILIEYLHILYLDYFKAGRSGGESVSASKKALLYVGIAFTLAFCTFDHIAAFGFVLPAVGNILFTIFLFFTRQVIVPERLFGLEALISRFFAVLILSLIITGFFALLYPYISSSFALFLLNSFLISFAVLALWSPLVTLFRLIAARLVSSSNEVRMRRFERFKVQIASATTEDELVKISNAFFKKQFEVREVSCHLEVEGRALPEVVSQNFISMRDQKRSPGLYREILERELDQVLASDRKQELGALLDFLRARDCDGAYPIEHQGRILGWIEIVGISRLSELPESLTLLAENRIRIFQFEAAREKDRLALLGEMAAGLAHEVRNPLGAIRGAADLMDPASGPWVKVIREEVDRLNRLVSQFLDFSRDQQEKREEVDLNELLPRILEQTRHHLPPGVQLDWIPSENPQRVSVVPDSLQQIVLNLLQNSIKALEGREQPKVTVRTGEAGFSVIDNGVGMAPEILEKVFQPFFTSFKNGTGLGLAITEKLVRFDQGKLQIYSALGKGTEVRVEYPDAR